MRDMKLDLSDGLHIISAIAAVVGVQFTPAGAPIASRFALAGLASRPSSFLRNSANPCFAAGILASRHWVSRRIRGLRTEIGVSPGRRFSAYKRKPANADDLLIGQSGACWGDSGPVRGGMAQ
jgi:hypothetical protein